MKYLTRTIDILVGLAVAVSLASMIVLPFAIRASFNL